MKLPDKSFINDVSAGLLNLRTNLSELGKYGIDAKNYDCFQRTIKEFVQTMTVEDHVKIEDIMIELEVLSSEGKIPLTFLHNMLINSFEEEIDIYRKKAGEKTTVRSAKLKEAAEMVSEALESYESEVESSDDLILAIKEAVSISRSKVAIILGNVDPLNHLRYVVKVGSASRTNIEFIYALNLILKEYKEMEIN